MGCEDRSAPALAQVLCPRLSSHTRLGLTQPLEGPEQSRESGGSAGGVREGDFSLPTFVCPGDQPEVLCFLLEFLLADLLGLDQMEYSCRGGHRASDAAVPSSRLTQGWVLCPLLALPAPGPWLGAGPAARAWWELAMEPGLAKARTHLISVSH